MLRSFVVACIVVAAQVAHADTVALLPLDADKRLEIYGQPVAAEVGRALKAAGLEVVVVSAKMDVPGAAQLIVDGSITAVKPKAKGKAESITLSMRIRDPKNGTVLENLPPSTATLTTIDKAAGELSAKIVPAVKSHLAALATRPVPTNTLDKPLNPSEPAQPATKTSAEPQLPVVLAAAIPVQPDHPVLGLLAGAMSSELAPWLYTHHREARLVDASTLARPTAQGSITAQHAAAGISFEVLGFFVDPGAVPMARARVRVRIADATAVLFERVIITDTIVGDRDITEQEMAARTAREVLAIANAQLRRKIAGWK